ncbi:MAG: lytic transglycosylase domain-containing protein [Betaproteobacteria bacterium]
MAGLLTHNAIASAREGRFNVQQIPVLRAEAQALEHAEGVARNPGKAARLYCEAARLGDAESQFNLGWMYANGRGLERSDAKAAYFFRLAAKQGHEQAQNMLRFVGEPVAKAPACLFDPIMESAGDAIRNPTPAQKKIIDLVERLAPEYGVSPTLALAVIRVESNFNPTAVSPKNAQGLMQLIPGTSLRFNVRKPFDPEQNIRGGLSYLRWLLAYFEGNVALVAAAYNAGEKAVERFKGIPPYEETRGYVKRIMEVFKRPDHPYDPAIASPSPGRSQFRNLKLM